MASNFRVILLNGKEFNISDEEGSLLRDELDDPQKIAFEIETRHDEGTNTSFYRKLPREAIEALEFQESDED